MGIKKLILESADEIFQASVLMVNPTGAIYIRVRMICRLDQIGSTRLDDSRLYYCVQVNDVSASEIKFCSTSY